MASLTATITTPASGPWSLAQLFGGGALTGVTVVHATPSGAPRIARYVSVQSDPANTAANYIQTGDHDLLNGAVGRSLAPGEAEVRDNVMTALTGLFVNATLAGMIVNITAEGGFQ